jgi:hypothetical protein
VIRWCVVSLPGRHASTPCCLPRFKFCPSHGLHQTLLHCGGKLLLLLLLQGHVLLLLLAGQVPSWWDTPRAAPTAWKGSGTLSNTAARYKPAKGAKEGHAAHYSPSPTRSAQKERRPGL